MASKLWQEASQRAAAWTLLGSAVALTGQARRRAARRERQNANRLLPTFAADVVESFVPLLCQRRLVHSAVETLSSQLEAGESVWEFLRSLYRVVAKRRAVYANATSLAVVAAGAAAQVYARKLETMALVVVALAGVAMVGTVDLSRVCEGAKAFYGPALRAAAIAAFEPETERDAFFLASQTAVVAARLFAKMSTASQPFSPPDLRLGLASAVAVCFAVSRLEKRCRSLSSSQFRALAALFVLPLASLLLAPQLLALSTTTTSWKNKKKKSFLFLFSEDSALADAAQSAPLARSFLDFVTDAHLATACLAFLVCGTPFFLALVALINTLLRRHAIHLAFAPANQA